MYIKEEQQYNSVTRWKDLADRKTDTQLTVFYMFVNYKVNISSEGIIIPMKWGTRKSQTHNIGMHIGSNIDN